MYKVQILLIMHKTTSSFVLSKNKSHKILTRGGGVILTRGGGMILTLGGDADVLKVDVKITCIVRFLHMLNSVQVMALKTKF